VGAEKENVLSMAVCLGRREYVWAGECWLNKHLASGRCFRSVPQRDSTTERKLFKLHVASLIAVSSE
jgi:hypothetical protein